MLPLQGDGDGMTSVLDRTFIQLEQDGLLPSLEDSQAYTLAERRLLTEQLGCPDESVESAQRFAQKYSYEETERATYHAMESLILDLNTMHSPRRRTDSLQLAQLRDRHLPEGRMVIRSLLLAEQSGLGARRNAHLPHPHLQSEGRGQLPSRRPELRPVLSGVPGFRQTAVPPTFSFWTHPITCNTTAAVTRKPRSPIWAAALASLPTSMTPPAKSPPVAATCPTPPSTCLVWDCLPIKIWTLFFELLDQKIDLVIQQLLDRFRIQGQKKVINFPS